MYNEVIVNKRDSDGYLQIKQQTMFVHSLLFNNLKIGGKQTLQSLPFIFRNSE
jgi:hypothetical protein